MTAITATPSARADEIVSKDSPPVTACANPNLPRELLDGTLPGTPVSPLRVIDASASGLKLRLAVAGNEADREQGLMCVTKIRPQHGMIFVFDTSRQWDFWMKNTLVPLDMVWVTAGGSITGIAADVPASTMSTPDAAVARRSGSGKFVIELASGEAASDNLKIGERLSLPPLYSSH